MSELSVADSYVYENLTDKCEAYIKKLQSSDTRFVNFSERTTDSIYGVKEMKGFYKGQYATIWNDVILLKHATALHIYQQLLQNEKPKTILELGTWQGGSALWFSDMCNIFNLKETKILTLDKNHDFLSEKVKNKNLSNVQFILGDVTRLSESLTPAILQELPHPWLVMDDCHVECDKVMSYLSDFMMQGDYYVMEDCHPCIQKLPGQGFLDGTVYDPIGFDSDYNVYAQLKNAMKNLDGIFKVDTLYCDYYGYNSSTNMNGYFRKMK